ncbi:type II secretion system protein GspM [Thermodesulfobacteriota bacterium]
MRDFWMNLNGRERLFLSTGAVIVLLLSCYMMLIEPFVTNLYRLRREVPLKRLEVAWMQHAAQEVKKIRGSGNGQSGSGETGSPLAIIDQTASYLKLGGQLKRVEPDDQGSIRVWLENVVYTDMVKWFTLLEKKGLHAIALNADRLDAPGFVNAKIVLKGAP